MLNNLYCIIGKSGSGKDTLANELQKRYGFKKVLSNTTRPLRKNDETDKYSHVFTTEEQYRQDVINNQVVADTYYNGNYYWVTEKMLDDADIYVIDPQGLRDLKNKYTQRPIVSMCLLVSDSSRIERMIERGDDIKQISKRIENDNTARAHLHDYDYWIDAEEDEKNVLAQVYKIISECEKMIKTNCIAERIKGGELI